MMEAVAASFRPPPTARSLNHLGSHLTTKLPGPPLPLPPRGKSRNEGFSWLDESVIILVDKFSSQLHVGGALISRRSLQSPPRVAEKCPH